MGKIKENSLYLVISEEHGKGRSALEIADAAIKGGVDIIQMREKNSPRAELINMGKALSCLCKDNNVIFIVNDDPGLAKELDADGVHLGQEDVGKYPIRKVRELLGDDKIIGISTHSVKEFRLANDEDVDYIAFGPIFETKTKDYFLGLKDVKEVAGRSKKPVFFIGGINLSNIEGLLKEGVRNIALIRGITEAADVRSRTTEFVRLLRRPSASSQ